MEQKIIEAKGFNTPKTKVGQTKMNLLIEAAEELFTTKGFYQTSISDICKQAKTAVGTFYIYFNTKSDIYRYMMDRYEHEIKQRLSDAIKDCKTRKEKEREGIRCFIKYAVKNPNMYNIIWGSLSVDKNLFINYYVSFARSYSASLVHDGDQLTAPDPAAVAYMLMGISNFLGLRAIFEEMSDERIDAMVDESLTHMLTSGILK